VRERPVFDDAHWHWNGKYPPDLRPPAEDGGEADLPPVAFIAFFLAWAIDRGLACAEHADRAVPEVRRLADRSITPWQYLDERIGCRLEDGDFNERGLAFAKAYYSKGGKALLYYTDFSMVFDEVETPYHVADTWANYDRLTPLLDHAYATWQEDGGLAGWEWEALDWWEWRDRAPEEGGEDEDAEPGAAADGGGM